MKKTKRGLSMLISLALILSMGSLLAHAEGKLVSDVHAHTHEPGKKMEENYVEPTCTKTGSYELATYCQTCGAELSREKHEIPKAEHEPGKAMEDNYTPPTCSALGGYDMVVHCLICETELSRVHYEIPTGDHQYKNGVCVICGAEEEPEYDETLKFYSVTLTLESDLTMNFYVAESVLAGWSEPYVVFSKPIYNAAGEEIGQETRTVRDCVYNATLKAYAFPFTGICATEMSSSVTATIYGKRNGVLYKGRTGSKSVKAYVANQLKSNDAKLKTMLVDLLNYGASAQSYFNYNTLNLANADLTAEQRALATAAVPNLVKNSGTTLRDGATVGFYGVTLSMAEKVEINILLKTMGYTGSMNALEAHVTYLDTNDAQRTKVIDGSEFVYQASSGRYVINFSDFNALQMRTVCTVEIFNKQTKTRISDTLRYSIESYAYTKSNGSDLGLAELVRNMMRYGDAACKFFGI